MAVIGHHERLQREKREAILGAATDLFLESGYERTSLARIAKAAGVSTATLFEQFPTKAALFDAMVSAYWTVEQGWDLSPEPGDVEAGLLSLGHTYAGVLTRPRMVALFRIVIGEQPRFPELGQTLFRLGKLPFVDSVRAYLEAERAAGSVRFADALPPANQFLGMIGDFALWPRLLLIDYAPTEAETDRAIREAVTTFLARYGA